MKVPIITITVHFQLFKGWQKDLIRPHTPKGGESHQPPPREFNENEQVREASAARRKSKRAAGASKGSDCGREPRPRTPPPSPSRQGEGGEGSLVPSLIDTCNEETFRELSPPRPGLAGALLRPPLGRPGNWAGLGLRRRAGRATAHLPGALGPHAARLGRRLPQAAAARERRGSPKPCTPTGRRRGYLLSFNTSTRSAQFSHIVRPPPPPPPLRIALTDPDRRGGGERGRGGGRPAGGAGRRRGRAAAGTGRGAEWGRGPAVPGAGGGEEGGEGRCAGRRGAEAPAAGKGGKDGGRGEGGRGRVGREAAESLHRPDAAATADAAAILIERSGCARLFPPGRRTRRGAPRALIPPPPALSCLPPSHLSLRTHAARSTPRRGRLAALPFLFRPASPPSVHPLRALAHPAQPGSLSAAGRETRSQRGRGGSPGE